MMDALHTTEEKHGRKSISDITGLYTALRGHEKKREEIYMNIQHSRKSAAVSNFAVDGGVVLKTHCSSLFAGTIITRLNAFREQCLKTSHCHHHHHHHHLFVHNNSKANKTGDNW